MTLPKLEGEYLELVRKRARELDTDGCSGPTLPVYVDACYEHDIHYRTHMTAYGDPITKAEADGLLKQRIQESSSLGVLSPMSYWRWVALRLFGGSSWDHDTKGTPISDWWCKEAEA